jgi:S-layer homology domain
MSEQPDSREPVPPSRRRILDFDEMVAILVAFGAIGSILFWGLTRQNREFAFDINGAPAVSSATSGLESPGSIFSAALPADSARPRATIAPQASPSPATQPRAEIRQDNNELVGDVLPSGTSPAEAIAAGTAAGAIVGAAAPAPAASPAPTVPTAPITAAVTNFPDVPPDYWARPFVDSLMKQGITVGSPDGSFRPDQPVTRAEYAALVQKAFEQQEVQGSMPFTDVAADFWGVGAIDNAVKKGFIKGYPNGSFEPNKPITRLEVLLSLVNGLGLPRPDNPEEVITLFQDSDQIPAWAVPAASTAADSNIVVNYPARDRLNPNQPTTRAEVAALIHQALVASGKAESVQSDYIVKP